MRGFARLVAGGRAAVAGASSSAGPSGGGSSSSSSLLRPSRAAASPPLVLRSLVRSAAPALMLSATRRSYASRSSTTTTSLLDEIEDELDERPDVPAEIIEADSKAAAKAGAVPPGGETAGPAPAEQETREAVLKRLAAQTWSPEMWADGRKKTLYDRRLRVHQEGAPDECRWKTDPFDSSVWKLNRVARLIRRMPVDEALIQLKFSEKRSAIRLYTSLLEGKRRAIEKGLNEERLVIHEAYTEKALVIKRLNIMGRGRSGMKLKKSARIYFVLKEDKSYMEKVDAKHLHELHKVQIQGPSAHRPTHRKKVKIEGASTADWRW